MRQWNKTGTRGSRPVAYYIFSALAWACRRIAQAGAWLGWCWAEAWFWLSRRCRDLANA